MKEMKEQCFEMFLVIEMEIGYFTSLNGRHRPRVQFILLWEEEIVWKTDCYMKVRGQNLSASDHSKYNSVEKVEDQLR